eukprot:UN25769
MTFDENVDRLKKSINLKSRRIQGCRMIIREYKTKSEFDSNLAHQSLNAQKIICQLVFCGLSNLRSSQDDPLIYWGLQEKSQKTISRILYPK